MNTKLAGVFVLGVAAVGLALPAGGSGSPAAAMRLTASMTPRQVVTPRNKPWTVPAGVAKAKGSLTGTLSADRRRLTWRITFTGIGRPSTVIADVHVGKPGRFGPILVRLCTACKSGQKGTATLKARLAGQVVDGNTWLTLITPQYPNGVVRGQIRAR